MTIRFEEVSAEVAPQLAPAPVPAAAPSAGVGDDVGEQALAAVQLRLERLARLSDQ